MPSTAGRRTVRQLMVVVAGLAGLFALHRALGEDAYYLALVVAGLSLAGVAWQSTRHCRRSAAWGLAISAAISGVPVAVACVYLMNLDGCLLIFLATAPVIPLILGFGSSWAIEATRANAAHRRSPVCAWLGVIALAALPLTMAFTLWPLRLAFLVSAPALGRLADRVAAGETLGAPEWAGLYRVVATRRDPRNGNVALIIDNAPGGASGFVRLAAGPPWDRLGPLVNHNFDIALSGRWCYQNED